MLSFDAIKKRLLRKRKIVSGFEPTSCWVWQGALARGYGTIKIKGRTRYVHALAFQVWYGIPYPKRGDGFELDHLCSNKACFRPNHLEVVTHRMNIMRGRSANGEKTTCPRGHTYTPGNIYWDKKSCRHCRLCRQQKMIEYEKSPKRKIWKLKNRDRRNALRRKAYALRWGRVVEWKN